MKPRQNSKNFHTHSSNIPQSQQSSYSPFHHQNSATASTGAGGATALPPPPQQSHPPLPPPTLPLPPSLRNLDLTKLGLNLDDLPNLMQACSTNPNLSTQEDIMKCLQTLYGGKSKLPTSNDWPMQSVSPPDFSRHSGGSGAGSSGSGGSASVITSCNNTVGGSGKISFNNNINNGNNSSQLHKQEMHFTSAQHQATTAAALSRQFRAPATSTPQMPPLQQQQKSVLSLHQHHHQNDSNRRLNHQQHNLGTTGNSFANLNAASAAAAAAAAATSISSSSLDLNTNAATLSGNLMVKNSSNLYSSLATSQAPPQHTSIMDKLGSSIESMLYDTSSQQAGPSALNKEATTSLNQQQQQSLIRHHQQLQRLLKATGGQSKSPSPTTNLPNRNNDSQFLQRGNNSGSQIQRQLTSPLSAISPPQQQQQQQPQQPTLSSVPKSLLNLAACTSSSPPNNSTPHTGPGRISNTNQFNVMPTRQTTKCNSLVATTASANIVSNNRAQLGDSLSNSSEELSRMSAVTGFSKELLQQMIQSKSSASPLQNASSNNPANALRSSLKQPFTSIIEDQQQQQLSNSNRINPRSLSSASLSSRSSINQSLKHLTQPSDETLPASHQENNKEAFLASLQERAAKAGVSIGEISKPSESTNQVPKNNLPPQASTSASNIQQANLLCSNTGPSRKDNPDELHDTKEIESAISRVEARNDLSLLYPPMLLASNSQKQINALSAGIQSAEELELFTNEVRRIVSEECNIIYECKRCSNLFRSLANLVKHKRSYCIGTSSDKSNLDVSRRANANSLASLTDHHSAAILQGTSNAVQIDANRNAYDNDSDDYAKQDNHPKSVINPDWNPPSSKYNLRGRQIGNQLGESRTSRLIRNPDMRAMQIASSSQRLAQQSGSMINSTHTSLSKLLQSQPKNRPPVSRDSALMDALSMTSMSTIASDRSNTSLPRSFDGDNRNNSSSSLNEINEHLVRNSSLAKTLLDERVKSVDSSTLKVNSILDRGWLGKMDNTQQMTSLQAEKKPPKRKFLEDCIQRVKRDKLKPDEDVGSDNASMPDTANNMDCDPLKGTMATDESSYNEHKSRLIKDPLAIDDSDADSDLLTIDLDGPTHTNRTTKSNERSLLSRRPTRRISTTTSSTASSTCSTKLNTSSALLKALTRPVDTRAGYSNTNSASLLDPTPVDDVEVVKSVKNQKQIIESDHQPAEGSNNDSQDNQDKNDNDSNLIEVLSPLFDKYTCDICEEDYSDQTNLMNHVVETHTLEKMIYPCIFCSFSFISLENACRHIVDIHKKPKAQVYRLKDVVRSRSFVSNDFSTCSDQPPVTDIAATRTTSQDNDASDKMETSEIEIVECHVRSTQVSPKADQELDNQNLSSSASGGNSTHSSSASRVASSAGSPSSSRHDNPMSVDVYVDSQDIEDNADDIESHAKQTARKEEVDISGAGTNDEAEAADVNKLVVDVDDNDDKTENQHIQVDNKNSRNNVTEMDAEKDVGATVEDSSLTPYQDDKSEQVSKSFKHPNAGKQIKMSRSRSVDDDDDDFEAITEDISGTNTEEDEEEGEIDVEVEENDDAEEEDDEDDEDNNDNDEEENDNDGDEDEDEDDNEEYDDDEDAKLEVNPSQNSKQTTSQTTPSSSSAGSCGGSGGIMKLKIQLKTQPDEKSKVYRIV